MLINLGMRLAVANKNVKEAARKRGGEYHRSDETMLAPIPTALLGAALAALLGRLRRRGHEDGRASTPRPKRRPRPARRRRHDDHDHPRAHADEHHHGPPSESGGTASPSTTRTATEPAFTTGGTGTTTSAEGAEGLSAAVAARAGAGLHDRRHLRLPPQPDPARARRHATGSTEGNGQQAFFFVDGRYIGTDAKEPSASVNVVSQGETEVALAYAPAPAAARRP